MACNLHHYRPKWGIPVSGGDGVLRREVRGLFERGRVRLASVDITSQLQVHSLQARRAMPCCASCERRLLPGETLHVYESGRSLCTLCAAVMAEPPLRRERIRATAAPLAVAPRAA
jgi:hypothetical protein